jgi:hypothetical protein
MTMQLGTWRRGLAAMMMADVASKIVVRQLNVAHP